MRTSPILPAGTGLSGVMLLVCMWLTFCTLYLKTYSDGSPSAARAAAKGAADGLVKEATMGDTAISYDNEAVNAAMAKWGQLERHTVRPATGDHGAV